MAAVAAQLPATLVAAIKANVIVHRVAVACTALLVVDYFQTLSDEVKLMWRSKMSPAKALFFLVRYYPFLHTSISFWHHVDTFITGDPCVVPFTMSAGSCILTTWICDAVSYLRVYALGGRKKGLLVFLILWYIAIRVTEAVLFYLFARTTRFAKIPSDMGIGCVTIKANTVLLGFIFKAILLSLVSVTAIMIYIAWRKWSRRRGVNGGPGIIHIFLRDGVLYFIILSTFAVCNIIFDYVAPQNGTQYTLVQLQIHANAILTGRMLIDLRAFAERSTEVDLDLSNDLRNISLRPTQRPLSTMQFSDHSTDSKFAPYDSRAVPKVFVQVSTETTRTAAKS